MKQINMPYVMHSALRRIIEDATIFEFVSDTDMEQAKKFISWLDQTAELDKDEE